MNQVNEAETIIKNEGNLNGNGEEMDQRQAQEEEEGTSRSSANGSGSGDEDEHGQIDRNIETETEKDSQTLSEFIIDGSEDERSFQSSITASCSTNDASRNTGDDISSIPCSSVDSHIPIMTASAPSPSPLSLDLRLSDISIDQSLFNESADLPKKWSCYSTMESSMATSSIECGSPSTISLSAIPLRLLDNLPCASPTPSTSSTRSDSIAACLRPAPFPIPIRPVPSSSFRLLQVIRIHFLAIDNFPCPSSAHPPHHVLIGAHFDSSSPHSPHFAQQPQHLTVVKRDLRELPSEDLLLDCPSSFSQLHLTFFPGIHEKFTLQFDIPSTSQFAANSSSTYHSPAGGVGQITIPRRHLMVFRSPVRLPLRPLPQSQSFGRICVHVRRNERVISLRVLDLVGLSASSASPRRLYLLVSTNANQQKREWKKLKIEDKRSIKWLELSCEPGGTTTLTMKLWQGVMRGMHNLFHGEIRLDVDPEWDESRPRWLTLNPKSDVHMDLSVLAHSIVNLLISSSDLRSLLSALYRKDISRCQDHNTLFRSQTLATKMFCEFLNIHGHSYLLITLKPVIDRICKEKKCCEIDPNRINKGESIDKNRANLLYYFAMCFNRLTSSSSRCPFEVRSALSDLRNAVAAETHRTDMQYLALSSFLIMRFFAAALLNPKSFGLVRLHLDPRLSRTLLLLSKMLQRVANCTVNSLPLSNKEPWLTSVLQLVTDVPHLKAMAKFLDDVSTLEADREERGGAASAQTETGAATSTPLGPLKDGHLLHFSRIRPQWKKVLQQKRRHVLLTEEEVLWCKRKESTAKESVSLSEINEIRIDGKNMLIKKTDGNEIAFQTENEAETEEWKYAIERQMARSKCEKIDRGRQLEAIHILMLQQSESIAEMKKKIQNEEDSELTEEETKRRRSLLETIDKILQIIEQLEADHTQYSQGYAAQNSQCEEDEVNYLLLNRRTR
ncbi:hypothetical protein WR25_09929 [Diploscapter pachys]|uniref:Ras-GAP domain-containing protein n=1 Tax=Diploscapter pachys TaxID=2018661 RepID=A0A2A2J0V7_9BILA|nr:hypothetical protein WR25_09929 [Diploscapter pachys]